MMNVPINRPLRLVKDVLFAAVSVWILVRFGFFGVILGALGLWWYGRDAYFQAKILRQEKHYKPQGQPHGNGTADGEDKITLTARDEVKEVDYEKE